MTIMPPANPSQRKGHITITTSRGDLREIRSPSGHPPACVVRSGELPPWPVPVFEGESNASK